MPDLFPTKMRLELLRAAGAKELIWYPGSFGGRTQSYWEKRGGGRKVTARTDEMDAAGWIQLGDKHYDTPLSSRWWELTDAGRKVLEEAERAGKS